MQIVASYLLSTPKLSSSNLAERLAALDKLFEQWLIKKGANIPLEKEGFFKSKTKADDTGIYRVDIHESGEKSAREYSLEEKSRSGLNFTTRMAVLKTTDCVTLYATLAVSNPEDVVVQAFADAKCPEVIREAIGLFNDWRYLDNVLPTSVTFVDSSEKVQMLVARLRGGDSRKLPVVVVSDLDGEEVWPGIAKQMAYDLTAAAEVYHIDEDASSELTNAIGKINSCYLGAIRIYWPIRGNEGFPRSTVWTASRLLPEEESKDLEYSLRFRSQLRNRVLSAMSVSIQEPSEIASIKQEKMEERIASLEERAADYDAALALVEELRKENEGLKEQLESAKKKNVSLTYQLQYATDGSDLADSRIASASNDDSNPPQPGEVRFYKKISEAGDHDKFRIVNDCDHKKWQSSKPADKARKGIIRHEGRDDWKSMQHCARCTGPGMWRVQW